ncbi:hypothetical protein Tco_0223786 [Tanacetum coccineum]
MMSGWFSCGDGGVADGDGDGVGVLLPTSGELKADWLVRSQYYFNGEDALFIQSVKPRCSDFQRCDSKVVDYVKAGQEDFPRLENVPVDVVQKQDCTLVEQAKKPTCSTYVQVDEVINRDVPLVQETQLLCKQLIDVRPEMNGMVDKFKSKGIDTLTTTFESARKHAEVVEAEVVNYETNLVECSVVEKDVGVLRAVVVSCEMNLVDCPVVQEDISDPKNLTHRDTQPSTMEHLVNACAFVIHPLPFYDSLKADKFVETAQVINDKDDYMDIENDPSKYCLDNLTIGIEEDTQNGELTVSLYEEQIANENNDFDKLLKASKVNVVKGDGKPVLGKVFEAIGRIKKPIIFKQAPYMQQRPTTSQVKKKRKRSFEDTIKAILTSLVVDERFWLALLGLNGNRRGWMLGGVYFPINKPQTYWALAVLQIRTGVITVYDSMTPLKRNKKLPIQDNRDWLIRWLPLVFGDPLQTALAYRKRMLAYLWKHKMYNCGLGRIALDSDDDVLDVLRFRAKISSFKEDKEIESFSLFRVKEVEFWVKKGFSAHVSSVFGSGGSIRRIQVLDMGY